MSTVSTEVVRRVYDDTSGAYIEVGPGADGFGVELRTVGGENITHFGPLRLCVDGEFAVALGNAMIAAAKDAE